MLSLALSYNFKIIYSYDIEETSNILEIIHKHGKYEKVNKAFIGEKYAERLLKNLKTIKNIVNASP
ncbi:MAG: hypothetical protein QXP60_08075 [Nitrososphaerota archaeon]